MSRKVREVKEARSKEDIRLDIRNYIRNERDTVMVKWRALSQTIKAEDQRRVEFLERKARDDTKILPLSVVKFIGSLKKSVHNTIRHKGGSLGGIIRNMFLYWDADKSGQISAKELFACMRSLGVKVTHQQCQEIVRHYQGHFNYVKNVEEMDYRELLIDISKDEPTITQFVQFNEEEHDRNEIRFEDRSDKFMNMPPVVVKFIEAVENYISVLLRNEGGTPEQHIRRLCKSFDYTYTGGLSPSELQRAARRKLKLHVTDEHAHSIVEFYDRKNTGEIDVDAFVFDVCKRVKPVLSFTEHTPHELESAKKALAVNPFIPVPFSAPPNRILEKFKQDVKTACITRVNRNGGTVASWIREAFVLWDPTFSLKISRPEYLIGAAKRLGVTLTVAEARVIMRCYDVENTGEMHYNFLTSEITNESPNFLMTAKIVDDAATTSRAPPAVRVFEQKAKQAVDNFVIKSKGTLVARDVFHGTFARFDRQGTGRIDQHSFRRAVDELRAGEFSEAELMSIMKWFDTDGSQQLDYHAVTRQFYGQDIQTEPMVLPAVKEQSTYAQLVETAQAKQTLNGVFPVTCSTGDQYISMAKSSLLHPSPFGVKPTTAERNLDVIESEAIKNARMKMKRNKIMEEKKKVERKLASIERQRKQIITDLKTRRSQSA